MANAKSQILQSELDEAKCALKADVINPLFKKYEITTINRIAGFLAQCSHESGGFKVKEENLNYSADALNRVFPKYFKNAGVDANEYARKPEKIANRVYANRMGNGDEASGEGYKYRGRGYIQLTGKENYTKFANKIGKSLDEAVEYCTTDAGALESALFFWSENNLNSFCDKDDIVGMTKRINGGTNGLEDRKEKYEKFKTIFI